MRTVTHRMDATWRGISSMPFVSIEVDEADHIGRIIGRGAWYERDLLDDAFARIQGPGMAIDIGAHIGNHSLWFARVMGLTVVALEPNPDTYRQLVRNVELNDLSRVPWPDRPAVQCINAAAGARPGWGRMTEPQIAYNSGTCAVVRDPEGAEQDADSVAILTLDTLPVTENVRLIKIDVEGAASSVLVGAAELIASQSPLIYAEGDRNAIKAVLPQGYKCIGKFGKTPTWGFTR